MKKIINFIRLGNIALIIWLIIFPTIGISIWGYNNNYMPFGTKSIVPWTYGMLMLSYGFVWIFIIAIPIAALIIILFQIVKEAIEKMNKVTFVIGFILFSFSLTAQSNFYMRDYTCVYQGKEYSMSIGVFDPRIDGSIVVRCEKPNKEWSLKSYDFHSYVPLGYLFFERGNTKRRIIIEKDLYENIISIVFLYSEEKIIYKPIKIVK